MDESTTFSEAVGRLRSAMVGARQDANVKQVIEARDIVLERFGPVFSSQHAPEIEDGEVKAFLRFENNQHWTGLMRQSNRICADMTALRRILVTLLDEGKPVADRLNTAVSILGMGKAISTAMLLVAYPDRYGVWNNTSESALRALSVWPVFDRGASFGQRYEIVNALLTRLTHELGCDLWTLDALLWYIPRTTGEKEPEQEFTPGEGAGFGLERHLQEFLRDNWDRTELGKEWKLYEADGDPDAGYEFPCDVGRIDLLAKHRTAPKWLIIELKRNQATDETVGQVLRYMGWVRHNLAAERDEIRGLIVARETDDRLSYALDMVSSVQLRLYEVSFSLKVPPVRG